MFALATLDGLAQIAATRYAKLDVPLEPATTPLVPVHAMPSILAISATQQYAHLAVGLAAVLYPTHAIVKKDSMDRFVTNSYIAIPNFLEAIGLLFVEPLDLVGTQLMITWLARRCTARTSQVPPLAAPSRLRSAATLVATHRNFFFKQETKPLS